MLKSFRNIILISEEEATMIHSLMPAHRAFKASPNIDDATKRVITNLLEDMEKEGFFKECVTITDALRILDGVRNEKGLGMLVAFARDKKSSAA
jgi:hypothetical protein